MKIFGVIWEEGRGDRSPNSQRAHFIAHGVAPDNIITLNELPLTKREGQVFQVIGIDWLGFDPARKNRPYPTFASRWYREHVSQGPILEDITTGKAYAGLDGLADLLEDWTIIMRNKQTAKGREAIKKTGSNRGRPELDVPAFYDKLSPAKQNELKADFEGREFVSIDLLAKHYGVGKATIYRLAKALDWKKTDKTVGK